MNGFEENIYKEIKKELEQNVIEKRVNTYVTNKNELNHYYNVGKMIVDAQGGEEKAKYGDGLIKMYSKRLTNDLGKGYDPSTIKRMRQFYLIIEKGAQVAHQLSWSHYSSLLPLNDINEINYYIDQTITYHWGRNTLRNKIKSKEYQRLSDKTKNKLIKKEELNIYDSLKNPITINTYYYIFNSRSI